MPFRFITITVILGAASLAAVHAQQVPANYRAPIAPKFEAITEEDWRAAEAQVMGLTGAQGEEFAHQVLMLPEKIAQQRVAEAAAKEAAAKAATLAPSKPGEPSAVAKPSAPPPSQAK